MGIGFDNIRDHIIPMDDFSLKWRFTEDEYDALPDLHLNQLKPLDDIGSRFLWDYIVATKLHQDVPFKKDFFINIDKAEYLRKMKRKLKNGFIKEV